MRDNASVIMKDKFKGLSYGEVLEMQDNCKNSNEEFEIYQKLVELNEKVIWKLEEELCTAPINTHLIPDDLDNYAAPMDNLARLYMKRKEYAKAVPLLERALQIYRMMEIYDSDFTCQRYYALKKLVECQKELENKTLAILFEHELRLLEATSEILTNDNDMEIVG